MAISSILLLSLISVALSYPHHKQHITTIPFSSLEGADQYEKIPDIKDALLNEGAFAVEGLNAEYVRDLEYLRDSALNCLKEDVTIKLNEAGIRFSHGPSSGGDDSECRDIDVDHILATFDQLESKVIAILAKIIGDNSHVKNYKQVNIKRLSQLVNEGLFLMITPNVKLPMYLKNFQGRPVSTDHLGPDSVIFLVGQGLIDFLFQDASNILYSSPNDASNPINSLSDVRSVFLIKLSNYKL